MGHQPGVCDILEPRRQTSDVKWASRPWDPTPACIQPRKASATDIKTTVLHSSRLRHVIHQLSDEEHISPEELYRRVEAILEEMGYNREVPVLRWLGLFTSKILKRLCSAIYVNENTLLKVKAEMGRNPVLFVPTHRSYGDFILMSYVCFHYELDVPRIAAGMDFHGMTLMGQILRDSCAFFMRRSFSQDKLYSATFSEYVQTLVTHGDAAVEFFIEGTRSRSAKSLMPKFGFLSMALKPYFTGLVPDISIVPVNLSYDRCLEETLFAYELLGVPKPKESTKGFIKAMSILKEDYGTVFINFGEPLSLAEALNGRVDRSVHGFGPVVLQDLTTAESRQVVSLAHHIVDHQRQLTVLTCFNIIASVLNDHLIGAKGVCTLPYLLQEVEHLTDLFRTLGASVDTHVSNSEKCVEDSLRLHRGLVTMTKGEVRLRQGQHHTAAVPGTGGGARSRGCDLTPSTMDVAIPLIMLQHYVNPCCHYLSHISSLVFAIKITASKISKGELFEKYSWFRKVFAHEFVFHPDKAVQDFEASVQKCFDLGLMVAANGMIELSNPKLTEFSLHFMAPFIPGYLILTEALEKVPPEASEQDILKVAQEDVQTKLSQNEIAHPANLSLDTLTNALQSFSAMGAVAKFRRNGKVVYSAKPHVLIKLQQTLVLMNGLLPKGSLRQLDFSMTSKL